MNSVYLNLIIKSEMDKKNSYKNRCPVSVPWLRGLPNTIFLQDNARPCVAHCVLISLDIQGIKLLPWSAEFQICHPLKTFGHGLLRDWSCTPLQLIRLMKCGIRLEAAWSELPVSVIQTQFNSMPNRVQAVSPARGGHIVYIE